MGILKHLFFWPVTGPTFLARFSLEKVQGVVQDELTDDARIKSALLDLQLRLELDEIDEETFQREEAHLMEELREVRRWREEFGMGTRGGVVRGPGARRESPSDEPSSPSAPLSVPPGATLEVSLDWEDGEDEEGGR
jgi:hypothetical protein